MPDTWPWLPRTRAAVERVLPAARDMSWCQTPGHGGSGHAFGCQGLSVHVVDEIKKPTTRLDAPLAEEPEHIVCGEVARFAREPCNRRE